MLGLGGILARGVLGTELLEAGRNANEALPALFIELFPTWLAALIGVGILAAIMSTADGLVVSSSQIVANDIYRRSIVPKYSPHLSDKEVDRKVLVISRWSTVIVLILCTWMAWAMQDMNIALLVWVGTGGMMAPPSPVRWWSAACGAASTLAGAYTGLVSGMLTFVLLRSGLPWMLVDPGSLGPLSGIAQWLAHLPDQSVLRARWSARSSRSPGPMSCPS